MTAPAVVRRWSGAGVAWSRIPVTLVREHVLAARRHAPLAAALLTVLVLDLAVAPHLAVRGAAPDVLLVAVAAVAAGRGPRAGAAFGFAAGLAADLFLAPPLGTTALAFTLLGHVVGRAGRPPSSGAASAICGPASTCFACRTGRGHGDGATGDNVMRSGRARRRVAARRAAVRRALALTVFGVAAGQLATAAVATALGGLPFPGVPVLLHMAAVVVVSAPLGPPMSAAVRRLPAATGMRH